MSPSLSTLRPVLAGGLMALVMAGCTPTVKLEAPTEPIRFDVNVNITQEVRVKIDRELQETFAANPALFGLGGQAASEPQEPEN